MRRDTNSNQSCQRGIFTRILNSVIFLAGIAVYGAEPTAKSVLQNGDLNAIQKMNPVRVKQLQKNNNAAVDDMMPLSWFFNGRNCKLEMCQNPDNPKDYYAKLLYSFNTPDFTLRPVQSDARLLGRKILSDKRTPTQLR